MDVERYVDGRRVNAAGHPANYAGSLKTYIQLDAADVDQLDYQLFRIDPDGSHHVEVMSADPEASGGLFTFEANVGRRYVLVYNKAFKFSFINNYVDFYPAISRDPLMKLQTVKIRKGEDSSDAFDDWKTSFGPLESFVRESGVTYNLKTEGEGLSYKDNAFVAYDRTRPVTRKTMVYVSYADDSDLLNSATDDLDGLLQALIQKGTDSFLRRIELADLKDAVTRMKNLIARPGLLALAASHPEYLLYTDEQLTALEATIPELVKRKPTLNEIASIKSFDILKGSASSGTGVVSLNIVDALNRYEPILTQRYAKNTTIQSTRSGGGMGGSGGGRGSGSTSKPFTTNNARDYVIGTNGSWQQHADGSWSFVLNAGIRLASRWGKLDYTSGDTSANGWYHFNSRGIMDTGWFKDEKGDWYYCNTEKDGFQGKMKYGWHFDPADKNWYYLDAQSGMMKTGWVQIDGKWYYLSPTATSETYGYDSSSESWGYLENGIKPLGSMYVNTTTPDGFRVGADGAWIQ